MKAQKHKQPLVGKRKTPNPPYRKFNGCVYERHESHGIDVEIELEKHVLDKLDQLVSDGKYLSRGDAVRDILRQMLREKSEN